MKCTCSVCPQWMHRLEDPAAWPTPPGSPYGGRKWWGRGRDVWGGRQRARIPDPHAPPELATTPAGHLCSLTFRPNKHLYMVTFVHLKMEWRTSWFTSCWASYVLVSPLTFPHADGDTPCQIQQCYSTKVIRDSSKRVARRQTYGLTVAPGIWQTKSGSPGCQI